MLHTFTYAIALGTVLGTSAPFAPSAAAIAQSEKAPSESQNDLRQENSRLQQQVKSLEGDLAAARQRIKELEDRLAQLEKMASGTTAPTTPQDVAPDPQIGPGGLLAKLRNDFATGLLDKEVPVSGPGTDQPSQQAWAAYKRALDPLIARAERSGMEVRWVGTIAPLSVSQTGREVTMTVVFTNGGRDYPTPITVDEGMVARLRQPDGSMTSEPITVSAVITPKLRVNPDRREAGAFEKPPLVAPFVEFGYELKPRVILPPERTKQAQNPPAKP